MKPETDPSVLAKQVVGTITGQPVTGQEQKNAYVRLRRGALEK